MAQEKRISDTPCSTLEGYGEGPQRAANVQDSWGRLRMHRGLDGWMLARALASSAPGLHHHEPRYFQFSLISVREQRLKIRARSSRDLVPTAGGSDLTAPWE